MTVKQNRVAGNVINLLGNYLSSRTQRVVINGKTSEYFPGESGLRSWFVAFSYLYYLLFILTI